MWKDAKTNTHSLKYRLFRGENECQDLYRTSAGVVFGEKDAMGDHTWEEDSAQRGAVVV